MRTKIHKITTTLLGVCLLLGQFSHTFAQEKEPEKLVLLKLYPLPLATSSMAFGAEMFNKDKTRSTNVMLGIRYSNEANIQSSLRDENAWIGLLGQIERRIYVPKFKQFDKGTWIDKNGSLGIYWSPTLKMDYSINDFNRKYYNPLFDRINPNSSETEVITDIGKVSYTGITPSLNIGLQFTMFQYLYLDFSIGAGMRLLDINVMSDDGSGGSGKNVFWTTGEYINYSGLSSNIYQAIRNDGVQVTGGISIGVKL
jgi:hypothetical protein